MPSEFDGLVAWVLHQARLHFALTFVLAAVATWLLIWFSK